MGSRKQSEKQIKDAQMRLNLILADLPYGTKAEELYLTDEEVAELIGAGKIIIDAETNLPLAECSNAYYALTHKHAMDMDEFYEQQAEENRKIDEWLRTDDILSGKY